MYWSSFPLHNVSDAFACRCDLVQNDLADTLGKSEMKIIINEI